MQKKRISYFTNVCPALIRTHSLRRSASISLLLEFVDSILKRSRLDGASNVLLGPLESSKSTQHLVGGLYVLFKAMISLPSVLAHGNKFWDGF